MSPGFEAFVAEMAKGECLCDEIAEADRPCLTCEANYTPMPDDYWRERMAQRMTPADEVERLTATLKGFCFDNGTSLAVGYESSRPYGNKNVAASIAFHLGWDRDRVLCTTPMPEWVRAEAMELHRLVGERIGGAE